MQLITRLYFANIVVSTVILCFVGWWLLSLYCSRCRDQVLRTREVMIHRRRVWKSAYAGSGSHVAACAERRHFPERGEDLPYEVHTIRCCVPFSDTGMYVYVHIYILTAFPSGKVMVRSVSFEKCSYSSEYVCVLLL